MHTCRALPLVAMTGATKHEAPCKAHMTSGPASARLAAATMFMHSDHHARRGAHLEAAHDGEAADKLGDEAELNEVHVFCPLQRVVWQRLPARARLDPRTHL